MTDEKFYLILDLETTGFPQRPKGFNKYYTPVDYNKYDNSRILEIGYLIVSKNGDLIEQVNHIIKLDEDITNTHIHGITTEMSRNGINLLIALNQLEGKLKHIELMICHNMAFDSHVLMAECCRLKRVNLVRQLNVINKYCTMMKGKDIIGPIDGYPYGKFPKLTELHRYLFNDDVEIKHRALDDAYICKKCFFAMTT